MGSGGVVLDARPLNLRHRSLRGLPSVLMRGADGLKTGALPLFDRSSSVYLRFETVIILCPNAPHHRREFSSVLVHAEC